MKVLFISEYDPNNPSVRSGVPYYILQAHKTLKIEVYVMLVQDRRLFWQRLVSRAKQWLCRTGLWGRGGFYDAGYSDAMAKSYHHCWKNFEFSAYDRVLSISPRTVAFLPEDIQPVLWIDNTLSTFSSYPGMEGICRASLKEGKLIEQIAFTRAAKIFTASGWLKNEITHQYPGMSDKIFVMPRGANLPEWPGNEMMENALKQRLQGTVLHLLHVVSGWWHTDRKGSQMVLRVFRQLKKEIPVSLTIIGSVPQEEVTNLTSEGVTCTGPVSKESGEGFKKYADSIANAHFVFVPSKAEGFGIVYAEAAAFGVPSLALSVMGVTEAVQHGKTGWLLPSGTSVRQWANFICEKWQDKTGYCTVSKSAYEWAYRYFQWHQNIQSILAEDNVAGYPYP